jgi:uncharacterized membrane protein
MPNKFLKNLAISFVVVFAATLLYHQVLLGAQYNARLKAVSTLVDGEPIAIIPALIVSILCTALGYAWFVPTAAAGNRQYLVHGALMGVATLGTYTFLARALVDGWSMWLTISDLVFGLLTGLIMGAIFLFTEGKSVTRAAH